MPPVLVAPLHLPVRLAKTLAGVDGIIGGRLIAGLGTGWSIDEYEATAPRPFAERGAALDEFLDVAEVVWGPDPPCARPDCNATYPDRPLFEYCCNRARTDAR